MLRCVCSMLRCVCSMPGCVGFYPSVHYVSLCGGVLVYVHMSWHVDVHHGVLVYVLRVPVCDCVCYGALRSWCFLMPKHIGAQWCVGVP